jgi:hypothetical protein
MLLACRVHMYAVLTAAGGSRDGPTQRLAVMDACVLAGLHVV